MGRIFSVDLYLAAPPAEEKDLLDERMLRILDWQPVNEAGMVFWHDGDEVGVQRVRSEWCEEIGPVALDVIREVLRQKEAAVAMATRLSCQVERLRAELMQVTRAESGSAE